MGQKIQSVKGMNDLLPVEQKDFITSAHWQAFENIVQKWTNRFGYSQIRTPIVEQTGLFVRSIGEETDVVGKEMYTFSDSNDTLSLTLRPEGTASCLRAVVEHNLLHEAPRKLWYMGPMFRRERPQKGRYRQFHQVGIEALGFADPDIDAEIVAMCADLWRELGILEHLTLEINSLGNREERAAHRAALVAYLTKFEDQLDEDSQRRLHTNPLRVLDTKNPELQAIANNAPRLLDYLGETSRQHYQTFKDLLTGLGIQFVENPRLVRGLDYYNHTVFEWTTDKLGAQATVCGGGRYDGLIEELGGKAAPSIGFAMGIERLLLLVREYGCLKAEFAPDIFVMQQGEGATLQAMKYAMQLREQGFAVAQFSGSTKLKNQFKRADQSGARFALIIAEDELKNKEVTIKFLKYPKTKESFDSESPKQQVSISDKKLGQFIERLNKVIKDIDELDNLNKVLLSPSILNEEINKFNSLSISRKNCPDFSKLAEKRTWQHILRSRIREHSNNAGKEFELWLSEKYAKIDKKKLSLKKECYLLIEWVTNKEKQVSNDLWINIINQCIKKEWETICKLDTKSVNKK